MTYINNCFSFVCSISSQFDSLLSARRKSASWTWLRYPSVYLSPETRICRALADWPGSAGGRANRELPGRCWASQLMPNNSWRRGLTASAIRAALTCLTLSSPEAIIVPHQIIWSWYTGRWMGGLLHLVQRGGDWAGLAQSHHRCTNCGSPPINGQCTNYRIAVHVYWSAALRF